MKIKKKLGRPKLSKVRQKLRLWQNGTKLVKEYYLDPLQPVIDVDFLIGWPSADAYFRCLLLRELL